MRTGIAWAAALLGLAACGDKNDEKAATTSSAPRPPPSVVVGPAATSSAKASTADLFVVARGTGLRLYPLGAMAVLVSERVIYTIDDKGLHQDPAWHAGFSGVPEAPDTQKSGYDVLGLAPDAIWLQAWVQGGGTSDPYQGIFTYRWTGKSWGAVKPLEGREVVMGVVPIGKGRTAALALGDKGELRWIPGNTKSSAVPSAPELRDEAEDAGAAPPASASAGAAASASAPPAVSAAPAASASAAPAVASASAPATSASAVPAASASAASPAQAETAKGPPAAKQEARPAHVKLHMPFWGWMEDDGVGLFRAGLPVAGSGAGQIVLVGANARSGGARLLAERWAAGTGARTVHELPEPAKDEDLWFVPVVAGANEAWVFGTAEKPYLARFDGRAFARETPPSGKRITAMAGNDDGTVYLAAEDGLFRRAPGSKSWQSIALPAGMAPQALAVVAGKLWVTTSGAVLSPDEPKAVAVLPGSREVGEAREDLVRYPLTDLCTSPYVVLRAKVSPAAKSFPDVEEVVKKTLPLEGVELLTEVSAKWTYVGARVPTVEAAKKLRGAMNVADPKAGADTYCHAPRAVKRIELKP